MKTHIIKVEEKNETARLDTYLSEIFNDLSRNKIQEMIKNLNVTVNNKAQKSAYKLKSDDKIEIKFNDETKFAEILPENIPLDIVYEDENMLVINKPSGMLTHPTTIERENTLVNALLYKYGENLSDLNGEFRRGILHRLDRNTSGLLMVAKNNPTHEFLSNQIKEKTAVRKYLAIVKGKINSDLIIDKPIGRNLKDPKKMAINKDGKNALTKIKVLKNFRNFTFIECTLSTGRTHQIRVHLASVNHPVLNDTLYGAGMFKVKTQEQVLQAYKLKFAKPFSSEIIDLEIQPDEKITKILTYLENNKEQL